MSRLKIFSLGLLIIGVIICLIGLARTYFHNDATPPVITMEEDTIAISVSDDESAILQGVTAADEKDGDVTDRIVVSSLTPFVGDEQAERIAVIAAFDSSNNIAFAKRSVTYSDYQPMKFSLSQPLRFPVGDRTSGAWVDDRGELLLQATDCLDGDISSQIQYLGMDAVDSKAPGVYSFTVHVSNSAGDVEEFPLSVEYYDPKEASNLPRVELEEYLITINAGEEPDLEDLITGVTFRNTELEIGPRTDLAAGTFYDEQVSVDDSDVDYDTPGVYEATYRAAYAGDKDEEEVSGTVRLVIIVR